MKIRFKFKQHIIHKSPFNGDYLECFDRVPNINEHICFDGCNTYEVVDVVTELKGWKVSYTIWLN